jgi:hypothetical protein
LRILQQHWSTISRKFKDDDGSRIAKKHGALCSQNLVIMLSSRILGGEGSISQSCFVKSAPQNASAICEANVDDIFLVACPCVINELQQNAQSSFGS